MRTDCIPSYEDDALGISCGVGADEITAQTTDSSWQPCFSRDPSNRQQRAHPACPLIRSFFSYKLCGLVALTVWSDQPSEEHLMELDGEQFMDFMSK